MPLACDNPGGVPPWQIRGSALHIHLIFVTRYRCGVLDPDMLACCEDATRKVCGDFDAELREFNGEDDHVHLLVGYLPKIPCPGW
jgi:putative transposase